MEKIEKQWNGIKETNTATGSDKNDKKKKKKKNNCRKDWSLSNRTSTSPTLSAYTFSLQQSSYQPLKCQSQLQQTTFWIFFFFFNFSNKTSLDISCESSAWQMIDHSHEILRLAFFEKLKKNKNKCCLLQILLGALSFKGYFVGTYNSEIFFLFLHKNICCVHSLEVFHWGASNEYPHLVPQHIFFMEILRKIVRKFITKYSLTGPLHAWKKLEYFAWKNWVK